jgi:uncharacterized membrane protein
MFDVVADSLMTNGLNGFSFVWFCMCWIGYAEFARIKAPTTDCLSLVMHQHRMDWMRSALFREIRVADASIIANLERSVAFFASTSLLVLAGLMTVLIKAGDVSILLQGLPFVVDVRPQTLQFKILILICIFIYAFFTFTWSLRQFGFSSVLLGAMPILQNGEVSNEESDSYAESAGKVLDKAAHSNNYGLRAYYFSMALLTWFLHPVLFILASTLVVYILYVREFKSSTFKVLRQVNTDWHKRERALQSIKDDSNI